MVHGAGRVAAIEDPLGGFKLPDPDFCGHPQILMDLAREYPTSALLSVFKGGATITGSPTTLIRSSGPDLSPHSHYDR